MDKIKILKYSAVVSALLCLFFLAEFLLVSKQKNDMSLLLKTQQINGKVLIFNKMFVEKVLGATQEVSFEDRLMLENLVRELNDSEIILQWQKFTSSKTEQEAQQKVKDLLILLANKISY